MRIAQNIANLGKKLGTNVFGRTVTYATKYAAGCYFDVFCGQYRTGGLTFEIPIEQTTRAMRGRFAADTYELPERELVLKHLPPDSRVLELGGCIGVLSCVINGLLRDRAAHVVVEANPSLIPFLKRNRDVNGAEFSIEQCIVSRDPEAALALDVNMDSSKRSKDGLIAPTRTFEYIETYYRQSFDALVIDIEGAESDFIRENKAKLQEIELVVIEFHPHISGEGEVGFLREILTECGLRKVDQRLTTEVYRRV
jgi:FkbM family methyltransferase